MFSMLKVTFWDMNFILNIFISIIKTCTVMSVCSVTLFRDLQTRFYFTQCIRKRDNHTAFSHAICKISNRGINHCILMIILHRQIAFRKCFCVHEY